MFILRYSRLSINSSRQRPDTPAYICLEISATILLNFARQNNFDWNRCQFLILIFMTARNIFRWPWRVISYILVFVLIYPRYYCLEIWYKMGSMHMIKMIWMSSILFYKWFGQFLEFHLIDFKYTVFFRWVCVDLQLEPNKGQHICWRLERGSAILWLCSE